MPGFRRKFKHWVGKEDMEELAKEERSALRDDENTKAMFSRCEILETEMLYDEDRLDRGDFVIARVVLKKIVDGDDDEGKYHDHWAIINER